MERDRWEQIERLYHSALEREPEARESFLDEACAGHEALRREVAGLLACDIPSDSFIQSPAIEIAARALAAEPLIEASTIPMRSQIAGSHIGAYQLLSLLGRGAEITGFTMLATGGALYNRSINPLLSNSWRKVELTKSSGRAVCAFGFFADSSRSMIWIPRSVGYGFWGMRLRPIPS